MTNSISKWTNKDGIGSDEIPAFAVSTDLAAKGNALSFWLLDGEPDSVAVNDGGVQRNDQRASSPKLERARLEAKEKLEIARSEAKKAWAKSAALAIAGGRDSLDKVDLVWVPLDHINNAQLATASTEGNTPVEDLKGTHVEITQLDLFRFCKVASLIGAAFDGDRFVRFTLADVKRLLVEAVRSDRVNLKALKEKLRDEIEVALQKASDQGEKKSPA